MKNIVFLLSLLMVSVLRATPIFNASTGNYYESVSASLNWGQARAAAESRTYNGYQGHLVSITSQAENDFITSHLTFSGYLIGLFQPSGSPEPSGGWRWTTDEVFSFIHWGPGEPNNSGGEDYGHFRSDGLWNDIPGSYAPGGYIVEYEVVPEPSVCFLFLLGVVGFCVSRKR